MGNKVSLALGSRFKIIVKTGDLAGAGTDANVFLTLYDDQGAQSEVLKLDKLLHDDLERGTTEEYEGPKVSDDFGSVCEVEIWRDDAGASALWYCLLIEVIDNKTNEEKFFPVQRWIKNDIHYKIPNEHTCLPQNDKYQELRSQELTEKKELYQYEQKLEGLPVQVKEMPEDEQFSDDFKRDLLRIKFEYLLKHKLTKFQLKRKWRKIDDVKRIYAAKDIKEPKGSKYYRDDGWFAAQQLSGCSPTRIALCTEIPENFQVNDDLVGTFLEEETLAEAIEKKKLFIVNHKIIDGVPAKNKDYEVPAPIALFYLESDKNLKPIAIQLQQEAGPENPVFLPSDPENLWFLAKMWFNLADAIIQQAVTHQCRTHYIMEGVYVSIQRNLALNHPVFRLLAPHFQFLLAINLRGIQGFINPDGFIARTLQCGLEGYAAVASKGYDQFRLNVEGTLPEDLKERGVENPDVLPVYPYRDDSLPIWEAIKTYVTTVLHHYYDSQEKLDNDTEILEWGKELVTARPEGVGLQGVPNEGAFKSVDDLVAVITSIIFTCTAQHALSFLQYDQFGFAPCYPFKLCGKLPKTKDHEPTEQEIVALLPDMETTLELFLLATILSEEATEKLGHWETQYQYDEVPLKAEDKFREELRKIANDHVERNKSRNDMLKCDVLNPEKIPNSICL